MAMTSILDSGYQPKQISIASLLLALETEAYSFQNPKILDSHVIIVIGDCRYFLKEIIIDPKGPNFFHLVPDTFTSINSNKDNAFTLNDFYTILVSQLSDSPVSISFYAPIGRRRKIIKVYFSNNQMYLEGEVF